MADTIRIYSRNSAPRQPDARRYAIMGFMKREVWILIFLSCLSTAKAAVSPQQAVANLEKRLVGLRSLQADFEQLFYSMSVSTPLKRHGRFYFQKPDLMRWEYAEPEKDVFLYRDKVFSYYIPEDNQLFRSRASRETYESEILTLFSGAARLADDYTVEDSPFPTEAGNVRQVKLTPRREGGYSYILLEIDASAWLILKAVFFEWAGNKNEFLFSRIKVDPRLPASVFELRVPPDCEIIEEEDPD